MANILVLSKRMEMGGTEKALIALLKFLLQDGHTVELMLLNKTGPTLNDIPGGVKVTEVVLSDSDIIEKMAGKQLRNVPFSIVKRTIGKISKILYKQDGKKNNLYPFLLKRVKPVKKNYDILFDFHGYGYFLTAYGAECINAKRKAVWFHDHNIFWADYAVDYYKKYDTIYCVSKSVKKSVDTRYPELVNKTKVLLNFIDINEIIEKSKEVIDDKAYSGDFKILTIGRLANQKGIDYALKTSKILRNKGVAFDWYVIGEGILKKELERLIRNEGIGQCFHLLGRRSNPYPYLKDCDLYVQPSRHEGYAITIIEARALEKPMILSDIAPNREQITNGKTGYLVPLNENALADKIIYLYNDEAERMRLSQNLREERMDLMEGKSMLRAYIEGNT